MTISKALNFTRADNDKVLIGASALLNAQTSFSFECWFKRSSTSGALVHYLIDRRNNPTWQRYNYNVTLAYDRIGIGFRNAADTLNASFYSTLTFTDTSSWHYLGVSHTFGNGAGTIVCVDGVQVAGNWTNGDELPWNDDNIPTTIGLTTVNNNGMDGGLEEIRLYNGRQMSLAEMQLNYNSGHPHPMPSNMNNLVLWLPMNEGLGNITYDRSDSGLDGTIAGADWIDGCVEATCNSCSVYIGGYRVKILQGSISIEKRIEERSTASFVIVDEDGTGTYARGSPVEIYDQTMTLIFSGFIDNPTKKRISPKGTSLYWGITCTDNHYLADKRLVVKSYANQTLGYIVTDIFNSYLSDEGITVGEVQTGITIQSAIFNYVRVSEAFDALKELSGFIWFIDELKKLYFIDRATYSAPFDLDSVTHRPLAGSVTLSLANPLYRNKQYIRGGTGVTSSQTANFAGDGNNKSFPCGYPLAAEPTVTVGGVGKTLGIKGVETGKDYYWSKGDEVVLASVAPANGVAVVITYIGQYPLITQAFSEADRLARQAIEGGTGLVEDIVVEAEHESAEAMNESAKAKLTSYCRESERFSYETYEAGLAPGQLQLVTYSPFGFTNHEMLIESVSIRPQGETVIYSVVAITGALLGSWAKFFTRIVGRQDKIIKVGDSKLLALIYQGEDLTLVETTDLHNDNFAATEIVNRWIALPPTQSEGCNVEHEKLGLVEAPALTSHATEDYQWDDGCKWGFATWG